MWLAMQDVMLGRLEPNGDLSTPTCSAWVERGREAPSMVRGDASCQYETERSPFGANARSLVFSGTFTMHFEDVNIWEMLSRDWRACGLGERRATSSATPIEARVMPPMSSPRPELLVVMSSSELTS